VREIADAILVAGVLGVALFTGGAMTAQVPNAPESSPVATFANSNMGVWRTGAGR